MDSTSSLILLQEYEMCQCPVTVDHKHLGAFPKLSSMHASDMARKH